MRSGSPDGATEILLERLHYGKLAEGRELSIPANEGYGDHTPQPRARA